MNTALHVVLVFGLVTAFAASAPAQQPSAAPAPPPLLTDPLPRPDTEKYLKNFEELNPKLKERNLFKKLQATFGDQPSYALQQVFSLVASEAQEATKKPLVPAPVAIPREVVRQYFKVLEALDPKRDGQDLFAKLQQAFTVRDTYTAEQVLFIANPKALNKKEEVNVPPRPAEPPLHPGSFSKDEVRDYFAALAEMDEAQKNPPWDRMATLVRRYGDHPTYLAAEIRQVEKDPDPKKTTVTVEVPDTTARALAAEQRMNANTLGPFWQGLRGFKIRKDWSDVVAGEDRSQPGKKTLDDLEGARLSYSHDERAKPFNGSTVADTWSAVGALIYPFDWRIEEPAKWLPEIITLAPSISINKVSTQNPTNQVDNLYYRLGLVSDWAISDWGLSEIQARGAFVYATDVEHRASLPAGEFDIEPKFLWRQPRARGRQWGGLGYRNILFEREPRKEDGTDDSLVDWQVRTWLHLEGGDLQRNDAKWETVNGGFFRMGPTVQGVINFPRFIRGFSINGQYSYLEPISGPKDHRDYWKVGGSLTLYQNPTLKQKVSLTADYQKGGLTLSKQPVDIVTVGLGITY
jgi:hypothetical protein